MSGEKWGYMQMIVSGLRFDPANPEPDMIHIGDIALGLSREPRFAGHTKELYTVAQHSVMVSWLTPTARLWGLLHDASEAYLKDLPWPVKRLCPEYKVMERRLMRVIAEKFGLPWPEPRKVKHADLIMLATERRDLLGVKEVSGDFDPVLHILKPWPSFYAKAMFLSEFKKLTKGEEAVDADVYI